MTVKDWILVLFPVLTFVIGLVATPLLDEWRKARGRKEDAQQAMVACERATLLEVQEALYHVVRAAGRCYHEDAMAFKTTGFPAQFSQEADDSMFKTKQRLAILQGRVLDPELRGLLDKVRKAEAETVIVRSAKESDTAFNLFLSEWEKAVEKAGAAYRTTWRPGD